MSTPPGYYSREALRARLGDEMFEEAERIGREAPPPSQDVIELVRRVFAPVFAELRAEMATAPDSSAISGDFG